MAIVKPKKQPSLTVLKKRLTTAFNYYIRLRDTTEGYGSCISCGVVKPFSDGDAGHFVPATYAVHRWSEANVHFQCWRCNRFMHGNLIGYFIGLEQKLGRDIPRDLETTKFTAKKYSRGELETLTEIYKQKVKDHAIASASSRSVQ